MRFDSMAAALAAGCAAAGFVLGLALAGPATARSAPSAPLPPASLRAADAGAPLSPPPETARRLVCLTFDDGPSHTTPAVLEALAAEGVPATFFVVASEANEAYLPLAGQAQQAGHEIALHSASHKYSEIYRSTEAFWTDIDLLQQRLAPFVDLTQTACLRFPGGSTNTVSRKYGGDDIMQQLKTQAGERGWRWVDWNVSAEDAAGAPLSADEVCRNVTEGSAGREKCIVLMHDSPSTGTTVEALPAIIRWYKESGYAFCTVSQFYDSAA